MMTNIYDVFVLQYYYGGKFITSPKYIGGNSEKLQIDPDTLCYWYIIGNAKNFGYGHDPWVYYRVSGVEFNSDALVLVDDDNTVRQCLRFLNSKGIVDLYVDQQSNYECFEKSNKVGEVIENINELVEIDVEDVTVVDELGLTNGLEANVSRGVEDTVDVENTGRLEDTGGAEDIGAEEGTVDTRGVEDTGAEKGAGVAVDTGGVEDTGAEEWARGVKNTGAADMRGAEDTGGSDAIDLGFEIEDLGYDANIYNVVVDEEEQLQNGGDDFIVSIEVPSDLDEEVEKIRDKLRKREYEDSDEDREDKICGAYKGLRFVDHIHFKEAVRKYAIAKGVALRYLKSEPKRLRVRCRDGCPWLLFASFDRNVECLVVKTYNPVHTCFRTNKNMLLTCKHIQKVFKDRILLDPKMKTATLVTMVRQELGASVAHDMCQRAKKVVLREIRGSYVEEYANLWAVCCRVDV
ncbi:hypothetical protein V6N13_096802 [Hibiscus sabdariffa]